jgi:hypothetical protein
MLIEDGRAVKLNLFGPEGMRVEKPSEQGRQMIAGGSDTVWPSVGTNVCVVLLPLQCSFVMNLT